MQAGAAILHDPGVRAYYDQLRSREIGHNAALRQVGNRLVSSTAASKPPSTRTRRPPGPTDYRLRLDVLALIHRPDSVLGPDFVDDLAVGLRA